MQDKLFQVEKAIEKTKDELSRLPPGKIVLVHNGNYTKWYVSDGHKSTYIPKKQRKLAAQLARKKYLRLRLLQLQKEQNAINSIVQPLEHTNSSIEALLANPEYQRLLSSWSTETFPTSDDWAREPFPTNPMHPEHLIHSSVYGIMVRSKSESLIALSLAQHHIPFRYECLLELNGSILYPDFTILHPVSREIFYWEHFGMMDSSAYANDATNKLQLYCSNHIIPGKNLITTYETSEAPLCYDTIEKTIRLFL